MNRVWQVCGVAVVGVGLIYLVRVRAAADTPETPAAAQHTTVPVVTPAQSPPAIEVPAPVASQHAPVAHAPPQAPVVAKPMLVAVAPPPPAIEAPGPLPKLEDGPELPSLPPPAPRPVPPAMIRVDHRNVVDSWPTVPAPKSQSPCGPAQPKLESVPTPAPVLVPEALADTGTRSDQEVSVEWRGPATAQLGTPTEYSLQVRNIGPNTLYAVTVAIPLANGMKISAVQPESRSDGKMFVFSLGDLHSHQERTLQLSVAPGAKGEMTPRAVVKFSRYASASLHVSVREPKLTLKTTAPAKVVAGDSATFLFTVTNPGDGPAERVRISAALSDGLEHAEGKQVRFELGSLAAGETRTLQMVCTARSGGKQKCTATVEATGNLSSRDECALEVLTPRLDLTVAGPGVRYINRKAAYSVHVTNKSEIPAGNVTVTDVVPAGFKFLTATRGGSFDAATRTVTWLLGDMGPGQSNDVQLELMAVATGQLRHHVSAGTERDGKIRVERDLLTRVEDLSALLLEVKDTDDPVEVGKETTYEVIVTNGGSKTETDVRVICAIPDRTELKAAEGPTRYYAEGNVVVFEPLPKLAPKSDALFRIKVKALAPGDVRFKARVTSANVVEPVIQIEATQLYSDQAP